MLSPVVSEIVSNVIVSHRGWWIAPESASSLWNILQKSRRHSRCFTHIRSIFIVGLASCLQVMSVFNTWTAIVTRPIVVTWPRRRHGSNFSYMRIVGLYCTWMLLEVFRQYHYLFNTTFYMAQSFGARYNRTMNNCIDYSWSYNRLMPRRLKSILSNKWVNAFCPPFVELWAVVAITIVVRQ